MTNVNPAPGNTDTGETASQRTRREMLLAANILAAGLLAIPSVGAVIWFTQPSTLVALNNQPWRYLVIGIFVIVGIILAIFSFFQSGDSNRSNIHQAALLGGQVVAFVVALGIFISGVVFDGTSGHPNVANVSVGPGSGTKVSFTVHADGVKRHDVIIAEVYGFKGKISQSEDAVLYRTLLHPNDEGLVDQTVEFSFDSKGYSRLTIQARPDHVDDTVGGATCRADEAPERFGCATVLLNPGSNPSS
ncbi:hypothetical protein [Streptomyces sp. NPDC101165]|uniref:hypothetical protein n=1 Tax=Streptomyces sp. NPDC101165 TaxID=3366119 RepID=UPI0038273546